MQTCYLAPHLWPVERPAEQELGSEVASGVADGLLYVEDCGNGWKRIGLTAKGREAAKAVRPVTTSVAVLRARLEARCMRLAPSAHWALDMWRESTACWILLFGDGA